MVSWAAMTRSASASEIRSAKKAFMIAWQTIRASSAPMSTGSAAAGGDVQLGDRAGDRLGDPVHHRVDPPGGEERLEDAPAVGPHRTVAEDAVAEEPAAPAPRTARRRPGLKLSARSPSTCCTWAGSVTR